MADAELLPLPLTTGYEPGCQYPAWVNELLTAYARANVAHATAAQSAEIEALRAELVRVTNPDGSPNLHAEQAGAAESYRAAALRAIQRREESEARAERLAAAGRRVTVAFRTLGETTAWTRAAEQARHECEAAMLNLDAALEQEESR